MSDFIHILCGSGEVMSASEIANFIDDGVYFDVAPRFDPPPEAPEHEARDWRTLAVYYKEGKRPIIFHKSVDVPEVREQVNEIIKKELADKQMAAADALRRHLLCCRQMITIEASALVSPTEEAWAMMDNIEAHLAHKYRGILYVPDEDFLDETLQAISLSDADGTPERGRT